jgi:hypothetical protein
MVPITATPMLTACSQKPASNESLPIALSRRLAVWSSEPIQVSDHAATAPARRAPRWALASRKTDDRDDQDGGNPTEQEEDHAELEAAVLRHQALVVERNRSPFREPVVWEEAGRHEKRPAEEHDRVTDAGARCPGSSNFGCHAAMMPPTSAGVERRAAGMYVPEM